MTIEPRIFEYTLKLEDGQTLENMTRQQVIAQRDKFRESVRKSGIAMNGADTRFEHAFQILIQEKTGNSLYEPDAVGEAYLALQKGFSYTQANSQRFTRGNGSGAAPSI